jgi:DNA-binding transcriptional ArsR family regulator
MTNLDTCLTALADPTRRRIFDRLSRTPAAVGDLARIMPVSRPAVSQHLKALKLAGLVRVEKQGTRHIYRIDLAGLEAVREYFDQFWGVALGAFKKAAEKPKGDRK